MQLIQEKWFEDISVVKNIYSTLGLTTEIDFLLRNQLVGLCAENEVVLNGHVYSVQCFMGESQELGFDIEKSNDLLEQESIVPEHFVAVGLLQGDDVICIEKGTGFVYLLLIESGDGEIVKVADTIESFIRKINLI